MLKFKTLTSRLQGSHIEWPASSQEVHVFLELPWLVRTILSSSPAEYMIMTQRDIHIIILWLWHNMNHCVENKLHCQNAPVVKNNLLWRLRSHRRKQNKTLLESVSLEVYSTKQSSWSLKMIINDPCEGFPILLLMEEILHQLIW